MDTLLVDGNLGGVDIGSSLKVDSQCVDHRFQAGVNERDVGPRGIGIGGGSAPGGFAGDEILLQSGAFELDPLR